MENRYKNLNNKDYWFERSIAKSEALWVQEKGKEKELYKAYSGALSSIKKEVALLLSEYETTYGELDKKLSPSEMVAQQEKIRGMADKLGPGKAKEELTRLAKLSNLSRLRAKVVLVEAELAQLGHQEEEIISDSLALGYEEAYYRTIHMLETGLKIGTTFTVLNNRAVAEAINYPWSGSMFSDLIWDNKQLLIKNLRETITNGVIQGKSYRDMAKDLESVMSNRGYKNILRVIRTEFAHVIEEAGATGYEQSGIVQQYIIIATLDKKTSKVCQSQDGKVYDLEKRVVGTNYPPFHPNCRTTVAPYFEETIVNERRARDSNGKGILVDGSLTYKDWKNMNL